MFKSKKMLIAILSSALLITGAGSAFAASSEIEHYCSHAKS
jgi:hypothetical protein